MGVGGDEREGFGGIVLGTINCMWQSMWQSKWLWVAVSGETLWMGGSVYLPASGVVTAVRNGLL